MRPAPHPAPAAVLAHHLVTGLAVTAPWLFLLPRAQSSGVPPVAVLLGVVAVVLPLLAVGLLRRRLHAEGLSGGLRTPAVRVRLGLQRPGRSAVLRCGLPAALAAVVLPAAGLPVEAALHRTGWFDAWPSTGLPLAPSTGTLVLWVVVAVVVGPVVEELLFRGLLQPLLPGGAWGRVVCGSALFAVYHLWQPAAWVTVWLATLPVAWVRERTGSTWLAAGVHVGVNAVALALFTVGVLQR